MAGEGGGRGWFVYIEGCERSACRAHIVSVSQSVITECLSLRVRNRMNNQDGHWVRTIMLGRNGEGQGPTPQRVGWTVTAPSSSSRRPGLIFC